MPHTTDFINKELKAIEERLKPPSIALLGRTGAGKSSLIKAIFGLDRNEINADAGFPQTKYYKKYPDPYDKKVPIILYDSPGYEANKTTEFVNDTLHFLTKKSLNNNHSADESIHLVWYLIPAGLGRIEYFDLDIIETTLSLNIPVIVVISQSDIGKPDTLYQLKKDLSKGLDNIIKKLELTSKAKPKIMEVAADPIDPDKVFGLDELTEASIQAIPKVYSEAFIRAQLVNIKAKRKVAGLMVGTAAMVCMGGSFIPIPGSTPASVVIMQSTLLPSITQVYNLNHYLDKGFGSHAIVFTGLLAIASTTIGLLFEF